MLSVDLARTAARREELDCYFRELVDDGASLVCRHQSSCRSSIAEFQLVEGQAPYLGSRYDLNEDGAAFRILVVPKQVGGSLAHGGERGEEHTTLDIRSRQVDSSKHGQRPYPRTDHMVGTELALGALLGSRGPEVQVDADRVHVFDCMAMANMTLCSKVGSDAAGQGSTQMIQNCLTHLRRTLGILEPTVVVAQGYSKSGWSPSRAAASVLGIGGIPNKYSATTVDQPWGPCTLIAVPHPARTWFATSMAAWKQVLPALIETRNQTLEAVRD